MKILLVLISLIAVSSSAILFPNKMDENKDYFDQTKILGRMKDDSISKDNSIKYSNNKEDNLEGDNINKNEEVRIYKTIRASRGNSETIRPFDKQTVKKESKVHPKKLHKTFNFYAKRIYNNRNNNIDLYDSLEKNVFTIVAPVKLVKMTKYLPEEKQDRKEFIFMNNKNVVVNDLLLKSEDRPKVSKSSTNKRQKRSSNIIEEENLFTTVSALRFTVRDTRLTNELYFKNINQ